MDGRLIDPGFLNFLTDRGEEVSRWVAKQKEVIYNALTFFGWSSEEICLAGRLGYFEYRLDSFSRLFLDNNIKYTFYIPIKELGEHSKQRFKNWQRHFYRSFKGAWVGLSLEEFVTLWDDLSRERFPYEGTRYSSLETLAYYMKGRRYGFTDNELRRLLRYGGEKEEIELQLWLRRRLSRGLVSHLLEANKQSPAPWILLENPEYVLKALKRGAGVSQVVQSVRVGVLHKLSS